MCGRYILIANAKDFADQFGVAPDFEWDPMYNIAPSTFLPILRLHEDKKEWIKAKWGLVPSWAKSDKFAFKTINARIETVLEKPAYRQAVKKQRCLVPSNGFYEWQTLAGKKQPYFVHQKDNRLFAFAGIWDEWIAEDGYVIPSFSILTMAADEDLYKLHDRFPVVLSKPMHAQWLEQGLELIKQPELLAMEEQKFSFHAVSPEVNRAAFDEAACIESVER
jgi:putative SOS response-associated peptidase YedK